MTPPDGQRELTVGMGAGEPGHGRHGAIGPQHPAARRAARAHRRRRRAHRLRSRSSATCTAAPRTLRGARLPADRGPGQPARLTLGVLQRETRRRAGRRADARDGVPERAVWAHTLLAEPAGCSTTCLMFLGSYPSSSVPSPRSSTRSVSARGAGGDGGGLRRADALHVQPRRRSQGGPAGRMVGRVSAPSPTCGTGFRTSSPSS